MESFLKNKLKIYCFAAAALFALFSASRVFAQTIYVPDNYPTIQEAVNTANSGDAIIVRSGNYQESIAVSKNDIAVRSESGAGLTTITAQNSEAAAFELTGVRIEVSGFSIRGAENGKGIWIKNSSAENKISNNIIEGNNYGIYISLASYSSEIFQNVFQENAYDLYLQEAWDTSSGMVRKSSANRIWLNDFYGSVFSGWGSTFYYRNYWNSEQETDYSYNSNNYKGFLGNYWKNYDKDDSDRNGIGNESYAFSSETDSYPLVQPFSNYRMIPEITDWSFAVLTDLHIGWGIPDYGATGYNDSVSGQDYFMTERLNRAVEWINMHTASDNIKFVVILGDISDTAEKSEFLKARDILNQLTVPYLPIIGNHDIIPYVSKPNYDPDDRAWGPIMRGIGDKWQNGEPLGDQYFKQVFWDNNEANSDKITNLFTSFSRQISSENDLENYYFSYDSVKFLSLDFASRSEYLQLSLPTNAVALPETIAWLEDKIQDCGNAKTILLTHYPLKGFETGFIPGSFTPIEEILGESGCQLLNLSGHTHVNSSSIYTNQYSVLETEALSQISFWGYANQNKYLRFVKVKHNNDLQEIDVNNFAGNLASAINPFVVIFPGVVSPNQPTNFQAETKNRTKEEIASYTWQFDNNEPFVTQNDNVTKWISELGTRKVKLTVEDIYGYEETISWDFEVKEDAALVRKMIMVNGMLIPMLSTNVDLRDPKNAQNTNEWVTISRNDLKLIGMVNTHFELADTDIDISDMIAETDFEQNKSVMHMKNWPSVIEQKKILYIPSSGKGQVYICPNADSLEKVHPNCEDATILSVGENKDGMTLNLIDYNGQQYYQVFGITGTGGGELNLSAEPRLENQMQFTKLEYGGIDILERAANNIGDRHLPLLLSELKQDKINLAGYLSEDKKSLLPGQKKKLAYKLKFLESIANEWQGKKIKVWFNFEAGQKK